MSSNQQRVKLNDGHFIPALGFGTYKPEEVRRMVLRWAEGSGENSLRKDGVDKTVTHFNGTLWDSQSFVSLD